MKNHVFRPLIVVIGIVALILIARVFYVPKDFGIGQRGYMYGWHRGGNEQDWKDFKVKYQGSEYCKDCHEKNYTSIKKTPHQIIPCEDCHGPAGSPEGVIHYDEKRPKLVIEKGKEQKAMCLRCHFPLPYPTSHRADIRGIDPAKHNPDAEECSNCHNPHNPMEGLK